MPISLHITTGRIFAKEDLTGMIIYPTHIQKVLAPMIFSDLFDKFPRLQVVSAENDVGWAGNFIERMDFFYNRGDPKRRGILAQSIAAAHGRRYGLNVLPPA